MKELIERTLGLNIDNIPKAGMTITKQEYFEIMKYLESILNPQIERKQDK